MSDLIERLRAQRDHADDWRTTLAEEAADEIERLRRELDEALELIEIARELCDSTAGTQHRTDCIASMRAYLTIRIDAAMQEVQK
jgi:hypothetical protein